MKGEVSADRGVMALEQLAPAAVTEARGHLGRADDVGEEDRRQRPFGFMALTAADEELFDLVEEGVLVADRGQVIGAVKLHVARVRDLLRQVAPLS